MNPNWDLSYLYKGFDDPAFLADLKRFPEEIKVEQAILDGGRKVREQFADVLPALTEMEKLASALIRMREERGTVDLAIKEAHIAVHGEEIEISEYPRLFSHRLIEEFMIAANECVAEFGEKKKLPLLYRIHERPAPDKAEGFRRHRP